MLLDELEKAHPEVFNILLQIFEDGQLTDAKGRKVSFKNTIIIMTSNLGSEYIAEMGSIGFLEEKNEDVREDLKKKIRDALHKEFRPEFINRIDEIIIFNHLGKPEIRKIVDLEMNKVIERLKNKDIDISVSREVKQILAEQGVDQNLGARPLKRVIQKLVLDPLSMKIITGSAKPGTKITIDARDKEIVFKDSSAVARKREKISV